MQQPGPACVKVGPCPITLVNPRDIDHGARLDVMRMTDTRAVPAAMEWITVLHQSIVEQHGRRPDKS